MSLHPAITLRMSRAVIEVSSAWFRRNVIPAYGDTWAAAESDMRSNPHEARRLAELETEIAENGIQRPVHVYLNHLWSPRFTVADGMHRSIAAMHLGVDIPVGRNYEHPSQHPFIDVYRVDAPGVDIEELLMSVLSLTTFRASNGAWIQADSASGRGAHAVEMYLPHHPEDRETIAAELEHRLRASGLAATVAYTETCIN